MKKKKSSKKKYFIFAGLFLVACLMLLLFKGCYVSKKGLAEQIIHDELTSRSGDSGSFVKDLFIRLEPISDGECLEEHADAVIGCFGVLDICEDDFGGCADDCDTEFPYTDEIERCVDACDGDYGCESDCDHEYLTCLDGCADEYESPCIEAAVGCVYDTLSDCITMVETATITDSSVSDIGGFYETNFPMFTEQFTGMCEWLLMGDFISTPEKFGCDEYIFFGGWFAPYLQSIESFGEVCSQIGGTFTTTGEVTCSHG